MEPYCCCKCAVSEQQDRSKFIGFCLLSFIDVESILRAIKVECPSKWVGVIAVKIKVGHFVQYRPPLPLYAMPIVYLDFVAILREWILHQLTRHTFRKLATGN